MNDLDFEDRLHVSFIYQEMINKSTTGVKIHIYIFTV